ncbi:MAG: hypothetical protein KAH32_07105 [Chlamydiia bacterium]|nr:hypothetical protein [Chlamydiia bacterium]
MNNSNNIKRFVMNSKPSHGTNAPMKSLSKMGIFSKIALGLIVGFIIYDVLITIIRRVLRRMMRVSSAELFPKGPASRNSYARWNPKDTDSFREEPLAMFHSLQEALKIGSLYDIHNPGKITPILDKINSIDKEANKGSLFDAKILLYCYPSELLVYQCLIMTELLMQKETVPQHITNLDNDIKEDALKVKMAVLDKDIDRISTMLIDTMKNYKQYIKGSMSKLGKESHDALSDIESSYSSMMILDPNTNLEYEKEFLKNLNIILYMVSKEDLNNVDNKLIDAIKAQVSTYLSGKSSKEDSQNKFIESFRRITCQKNLDDVGKL